MIDAERIEQRRLKVVYRYHLFDRLVTELIGRTVRVPRSKATPGQPQ